MATRLGSTPPQTWPGNTKVRKLTLGYAVIVVVVASCAAAAAYLFGRRRQPLPKETEPTPGAASGGEATAEGQDESAGDLRLSDLLDHLPETVNRMGAARSTSALCRITVRALKDLVAARTVGLFVATGSPPVFRLEVFAGRGRPEGEVSFELGEGKLGRLAKLIGVRGRDDLDDEEYEETQADQLFNPDLSIAIRRHHMVYGFVAMDGASKDQSTTRRVVQMLADIHAVSEEGLAMLQNERAKAELDQLTGLFNRRHLDRRLAEEMARAQSYGLTLSIFLFDIDHFKNYNDTNGHQAGDECLQLVSQVARKTTRGSDVVCRYGGEEFLVILLGASREESWSHADRIRSTIANVAFPHGSEQPLGCVSVSGGVANYPADADQPKTLVGAADAALYAAKQQGRNRVVGAWQLPQAQARDWATPRPVAAASYSASQGQPVVASPPPTTAPKVSVQEFQGLENLEMLARLPVRTPMPMNWPRLDENGQPRDEPAPDQGSTEMQPNSSQKASRDPSPATSLKNNPGNALCSVQKVREIASTQPPLSKGTYRVHNKKQDTR
jgi:diguanylate cyclase (GGDEF)-like protein